MKEIQVSAPQDFILKSTAAINLFMAGAGSGKTFTMGLASADMVINHPQIIGFIGANTHEQLTKSTTKRIFEVWQNCLGWVNGVQYVVDSIPPNKFVKQKIKLKDYHNTISFNSGALIFLSSLENYKAIEGQEFGWAMLDETKDTRQEAIDEVILWRLRQPGIWVDEQGVLYESMAPGRNGYNPLSIFTSPAKEQWLNEMFGLEKYYEEIERHIYSKTDFFKLEENNKCVVISSAYHNEVNLPEGFIQSKIEHFKGNQHLIDTLVFGSPIAKMGGEFYHQFKRTVHVKKLKAEEINFHISCDQNVHPYYTMIAGQIKLVDDRWKVRIVKEYCLENPRNNMESVCEDFEQDYGKMCPGLFYYGDIYGLIEGTMRKTKEHHYDVLEEKLKKYLTHASYRLLSSNPPLVQRRDFINGIFAGAYNIDIEIDESCYYLIADFEYLKEDADGGKLKKNVKDKNTGVSYQKYGHTSDAFDYLICSAFKDDFDFFKNSLKK